jgi:hypothetical protein
MRRFARFAKADSTGIPFLQPLDHAKNVELDVACAMILDAEIVDQGFTCPMETALNVILHV